MLHSCGIFQLSVKKKKVGQCIEKQSCWQFPFAFVTAYLACTVHLGCQIFRTRHQNLGVSACSPPEIFPT
jgi:hypothetical protein